MTVIQIHNGVTQLSHDNQIYLTDHHRLSEVAQTGDVLLPKIYGAYGWEHPKIKETISYNLFFSESEGRAFPHRHTMYEQILIRFNSQN